MHVLSSCRMLQVSLQKKEPASHTVSGPALEVQGVGASPFALQRGVLPLEASQVGQRRVT